MKQKSIAFLLVSSMILSLFSGNTMCKKEAAAEAAEKQGKNVQNETRLNEEGLRIAWDIDWSDDIPKLAEGAQYYSTDEEQGADILWDVVWSVKDGDTPVSKDALYTYKWNEDTEEYESAEDSDVKIEACGADDELIQFSFAKRGRYHISLEENAQNHEEPDYENETAGDNCIKLSVDYPDIAFYRTDDFSEEGLIKENPLLYSAGDEWYVLAHQTEWSRLRDVSFEFLDGIPEVLFDIQTIEENKKYKVTANAAVNMIDEEGCFGGIRVKCKGSDVSDAENTWESEREQFFFSNDAMEKKGLLATDWMYWDEEQQRDVPDNDITGFASLIYTSLEGRLCFKYNDGTKLEPSESEDYGAQLVSSPLLAEDIKIYVKGNNGKLVEASDDIVTYRQSEEVPECIDFSFKNRGYYVAGYTPKGGEESRVILDVGYPQAAFYTGSECTENGLIRGMSNYSRNNRTFYLVLRQDEEVNEDNTITRHPLIVSEPEFDTGGKATVEKQSDTVYKITVNAGVTEEFDIGAKWTLKWDGNSEAWVEEPCIHLFYEMTPEIISFSITPKTLEVEAGKSIQLNAEVKSEDGTAAVTYKSGNDSVATVDANGKVTGVTPGNTEITVTAVLGESTKTETAAVVVKESAGGEKNPPDDRKPEAQKNVKAEDGSVVTTKKDGTAVLNAAAAKKKAKSVKVPDKVVVNGIEYTVTAVGANAFKAVANTVTDITLPATVTRIDKNAFKGLKKLKKITVKAAAGITVAKGAFKGVNTKKVTITVSKKMKKEILKKFKADLKKAGFKGKVKTK